MPVTRVTMSFTSDDPQLVVRVAEQFARTATGLALDGVETFMSMGPDLDDDTTDP